MGFQKQKQKWKQLHENRSDINFQKMDVEAVAEISKKRRIKQKQLTSENRKPKRNYYIWKCNQ